jgi:hypothetical protein
MREDDAPFETAVDRDAGLCAHLGRPRRKVFQPCDGGRLLSAMFCHRGLADIDPELEQLAVNARCSPQGVRSAHLEDELANVRRDL